jgi:hypothetical protein
MTGRAKVSDLPAWARDLRAWVFENPIKDLGYGTLPPTVLDHYQNAPDGWLNVSSGLALCLLARDRPDEEIRLPEARLVKLVREIEVALALQRTAADVGLELRPGAEISDVWRKFEEAGP